MEKLKYILILCLPIFAFFGCVDDSADNPEFGEQDIPHIYLDWQASMAYKLGQTMKFEPQVSPSDGATYRWTLNGEELSSEKDFSYTLDDFLFNAELKFEVTRNGVSNSRTANILVTQDFVPKQAAKKIFGFLTKDGSLGDVDWENITHLVVSSAVVNADGSLDLSFTQTLNLPMLVAFAHHYGVYVIVEVSGIIRYLNSLPLYGSLTFYDAALNVPDVLTANIVNLMTTFNFDGVNIYMDKSTSDSYADPAGLKDFYIKAGDKIKSDKHTIDGKEYDYILSMSVVGGWTRATLAGMVNLPQYDYVQVLAFLNEDLSPKAHSDPTYVATEITAWLTWAGQIVENPGKLILVAPAVGLRYFGIPANYTWANLEQFTEYISYRNICAQYPDAASKNTIVIKDNNGSATKEVDKIYYDNPRYIERKVNEIVIPKGLGGMGLWSLENDSRNPEQSLLLKMKTTLETTE
ncbi:MAG: hypothetical protein LBO74_09070 [Candidatus Symbiothrix sp.]|jgi:hypothetical protein|nr:hypothetical protein [Candidatus Symbiothrix sp.]